MQSLMHATSGIDKNSIKRTLNLVGTMQYEVDFSPNSKNGLQGQIYEYLLFYETSAVSSIHSHKLKKFECTLMPELDHMGTLVYIIE